MPRIVKRRKNKSVLSASKRRRKNKNNYFFKTICICSLIGVGVFYLVQVGSEPISAYEANNLGKKISNLEKKKEALELEVSKLQSLTSVNDRLENLKMVAVEKLEYLKGNESVAAK